VGVFPVFTAMHSVILVGGNCCAGTIVVLHNTVPV